MRTIAILLLTWLCLAQAGYSAEQLPPDVLQALTQSPHVELLSLDGLGFEPHVDLRGLPKDGTYYRQHIYGRTMVSGQEQQTLVAALLQGVAGGSAEANPCFLPRHGLRSKLHGHIYDLVICFQCEQMEIYRDGRPLARVGTDEKPHRAFNAMLVAHHTQLPPYGNATIDMQPFMGGYVDDSTLFHWNDLPPQVMRRVQTHLRQRLGEFAGHLAFAGGRRMGTQGYWFQLCFHNPDKGLMLVSVTVQANQDGTLAKEVDMPTLAGHPEKAIRLSLHEAVSIAAQRGLSLGDNYSVGLGYDKTHDEWCYTITGTGTASGYLSLSVSASSGQILKRRAVRPKQEVTHDSSTDS